MPARLEEVLARRLREVAEAQGIALSHVADRAAVARSYFWRLLDAESSATLDVIQRLADAVGVAPLELLVDVAPEVGDPKSPIATRARSTSRTVAEPARHERAKSRTKVRRKPLR